MWTMFRTSAELAQDLADQIKARRLALGLTQQEAAQRSGVAYRTWRRLETQAKASVEDLIKAAIALRCEETLAMLFPETPAASLDDLLKHQARNHAARKPTRVRGRRPS